MWDFTAKLAFSCFSRISFCRIKSTLIELNTEKSRPHWVRSKTRWVDWICFPLFMQTYMVNFHRTIQEKEIKPSRGSVLVLTWIITELQRYYWTAKFWNKVDALNRVLGSNYEERLQKDKGQSDFPLITSYHKLNILII